MICTWFVQTKDIHWWISIMDILLFLAQYVYMVLFFTIWLALVHLLFQSPKKVNLVAKLVRGMRVEDALLQLQVTIKRAAQTVYQVIQPHDSCRFHQVGRLKKF